MTESRSQSLGLRVTLGVLLFAAILLAVGSWVSYSRQAVEIARLKVEIQRLQDQYGREKDQLTTIIRELRDRAERGKTIGEQPDGHVTSVDAERGEVQVDINRAMGAHAPMRFSVFDADAPAIPTEKPKGTIELTQVGDPFSMGRITTTVSPANPVRVGDILYTPAWSPNQPIRFALIGKIDVNRDGKDDRDELKRMIQDSGGVVDFDLPPPEVGEETGRLTPRIDWYVIDDRIPLSEAIRMKQPGAAVIRQVKLAQRVGQVIKEARLDGIRPMPIGRLLNFLGYRDNTPSHRPGR